jgi:hypothetical protein
MYGLETGRCVDASGRRTIQSQMLCHERSSQSNMVDSFSGSYHKSATNGRAVLSRPMGLRFSVVLPRTRPSR